MTPPLDAFLSSARHHSGGAISQSALRCRHTVCGAFSLLAGPVKPSKDQEVYKREETVTGHRGATFPTGVRNACADAVFSFCPHHPPTHPLLISRNRSTLRVSSSKSPHLSQAIHLRCMVRSCLHLHPPQTLSPQPPRALQPALPPVAV